MKLIQTCIIFMIVFGLQKISAEVSYPIPSGENYFNDYYKGNVDLGAQYRFMTSDVINLGASVNVGFYAFENKNFTVQPDINGTFIQPRLFGELVAGICREQVGAGNGFATFSMENALEPGQTKKVKDKTNGPNVNVAASLDIFMGLFVKAQYDYMNTSEYGSLDDSTTTDR
ncbi:hypothetical protein [Flagellimonas sp.]|uniref:hypothetical protein n=1 Tax=Flagellimonas sp. TaxID=2058762 RepID=UPI003AB5EE67